MEFIEDQLRLGCGALHRYTKLQPPINVAPILVDSGWPTSPQDLVEEDAKNWKKVWHRFGDDAGTPWREYIPTGADTLTPITPEDLIASSLSFRAATGLGGDFLAPRWFAWLHRDAHLAICTLLMALEHWHLA